MASSNPWDIFDTPFQIQRIQRTLGYVNQTTGDYVEPVDITTTIFGNFDPNPLTEDIRKDGGLIDNGAARFFTDATLVVGDIVRVHHDISGTNYTDFLVKGTRDDYGVFQRIGLPTGGRREYVLNKIVIGS